MALDAERHVHRQAHRGPEIPVGDTQASSRSDQGELGVRHFDLGTENVGSGRRAGLLAHLRQLEMIATSRQRGLGCGDRRLCRQHPVVGLVDGVNDILADALRLLLGGRLSRQCRVLLGASLPVVVERVAHRDGTAPVVGRTEVRVLERHLRWEEEVGVEAAVARRDADLRVVRRGRNSHGLRGGSHALLGRADERILVDRDSDAGVEIERRPSQTPGVYPPRPRAAGSAGAVRSRGVGHRLRAASRITAQPSHAPASRYVFRVRLVCISLSSQARVFRNLREATNRLAAPSTARAAICDHSTSGPTPLRKMPRMMTRK